MANKTCPACGGAVCEICGGCINHGECMCESSRVVKLRAINAELLAVCDELLGALVVSSPHANWERINKAQDVIKKAKREG